MANRYKPVRPIAGAKPSSTPIAAETTAIPTAPTSSARTLGRDAKDDTSVMLLATLDEVVERRQRTSRAGRPDTCVRAASGARR
jgi:hypothetical protein